MNYLLTGLFIFLGILVFSQEQPIEETNLTFNYSSRLLVHYSAAELNEMRLSEPDKFKACLYYHTESYNVRELQNGEPLSIDLNTFDITPYERFRHPTETVIKTNWKKGFSIQLISIDQLVYKLPIHLDHPENLNEDDDE